MHTIEKRLSAADFILNGEYGSEGATVTEIGPNHFCLTLGTAPQQPTWTNKPQFAIAANAKGVRLRLEVRSPVKGGGHYPMSEYAYSWSYDKENWNAICPDPHLPDYSDFQFPEFTEDTVYFGHQVPFVQERLEERLRVWEREPGVKVHRLGQSLGGRPLYRLEIDALSPEEAWAPNARWAHYMISPHPGEHNAHWRMVGMIEWLLRHPEAAEFRRGNICHFVLLMCPDGPANGWYRVNGQGVDMNRSYFAQGTSGYASGSGGADGARTEDKDPDAPAQAHEAAIFQRDLEGLMAGEVPIAAVWNMHTWQGIVEPILFPGPEFGTALGEWTELQEHMKARDVRGLVKPLKIGREALGLASGWNGGPQRQFGITSILCEGGGGFLTQEENVASGEVLIQALADFYRLPRNGTSS